MIIQGYNIELARLTIDDIELVRKWRNSEQIQQFMEYRQTISKEQQAKWFKSIDNTNNNYFIISVGQKKIGLIYGAEIDWDKSITGNGGIFIWDENHLETKNTIAAALLLTDTSLLLNLDCTYIKILKTNPKAIAFNKALGYRIEPNQEQFVNQKYSLQTKDYIKRRDRLREQLFSPFEYNNNSITLNSKSKVDLFFNDKISHSNNKLKEEYLIRLL